MGRSARAHEGRARRARPSLVLRHDAGVTVLELIVVVLIVGILAAVAVPAYYEQRNRALDAQAKADARAAQSAALDLAEENGHRFNGPGGVTPANLMADDPSLAGAALGVPVTSPGGYTLRVRSETGNTFSITRNGDGTRVLTCASADRAGCPADGTWD